MPHDDALDQQVVEAGDRRTEALTVEAALEQVRRDSRQDPQTFLDQTTVPHGGE
jgi:hypothetical protein